MGVDFGDLDHLVAAPFRGRAGNGEEASPRKDPVAWEDLRHAGEMAGVRLRRYWPRREALLSAPGPKHDYCIEAKTQNGGAVETYRFVEELSLVPLFSDKEPGYGVLFVAGGGHEIPGVETLVEPQQPDKELGPAVAVIIDEGRELRLASLWTYHKDERKFVNIKSATFDVWVFRRGRAPVDPASRASKVSSPWPTAKTRKALPASAAIPTPATSASSGIASKTLTFEPAGGYHATTEYGSAPIVRRGEWKNIEACLSGSLPTPVPQGTDESGYVLVKTLPLQKAFNTPEKLQASAYEFEAEDRREGRGWSPGKTLF